MLEYREFTCCEAKIEENGKAGSRQESNPGHLACVASPLLLRIVRAGGCLGVVASKRLNCLY